MNKTNHCRHAQADYEKLAKQRPLYADIMGPACRHKYIIKVKHYANNPLIQSAASRVPFVYILVNTVCSVVFHAEEEICA